MEKLRSDLAAEKEEEVFALNDDLEKHKAAIAKLGEKI
jgi:hypothetical protein